MIVVDASAILEVLLRTTDAADWLLDSAETLHAPYLLDVEIAQVIRRYEARGELSAERGQEALTDLMAFPVARYPHDVLLQRVWELRNNLTAYDAMYIALAEVLDAPLVTRDERLASAPGHNAIVRII